MKDFGVGISPTLQMHCALINKSIDWFEISNIVSVNSCTRNQFINIYLENILHVLHVP